MVDRRSIYQAAKGYGVQMEVIIMNKDDKLVTAINEYKVSKETDINIHNKNIQL